MTAEKMESLSAALMVICWAGLWVVDLVEKTVVTSAGENREKRGEIRRKLKEGRKGGREEGKKFRLKNEKKEIIL